MTTVRPIDLADLAVSEVAEPVDEMVRNAAESVLRLATAMLQRPTTGLTRAIRADEKVGIGAPSLVRLPVEPVVPRRASRRRSSGARRVVPRCAGVAARTPDQPDRDEGARLEARRDAAADRGSARRSRRRKRRALREAAPPQSRGWRFTTARTDDRGGALPTGARRSAT